MATILAGTASRTNALARPDSPDDEQDPYDPTQPLIDHSGYRPPVAIDMGPTDFSDPTLYDLPAIQQSDLAAAAVLAEQEFH